MEFRLGFHLEAIHSPKRVLGGLFREIHQKTRLERILELQKAAKNNIKLITLAPELEGAIPFIKNCVKNGLVVSLGHHNGTATDIQNAVNAGARMATHLERLCQPVNRHHNPIWPQLSEDH